MGKFYIINAPFLFTTVWSVVKGWLDPVTVSKIVILGKSYKDDLLKQIPAENLPKDFGGKSEEDIFSVCVTLLYFVCSNHDNRTLDHGTQRPTLNKKKTTIRR